MEEDPDTDPQQSHLVYPRIENIYSDVNIKTEPVECEDNDFESMEVAEYGTSKAYYTHLPDNIILGTKPSVEASSGSAPGTSGASQAWEEHEDSFQCDKCHSVFSSQTELDTHEMVAHSFLVARSIKREKRSASKSSIEDAELSSNSPSFLESFNSEERSTSRQSAQSSIKSSTLSKPYPLLYKAVKGVAKNLSVDRKSCNPDTDSPVSDNVDKLLCNHCDVRFPNEIALIRHTYELIPESKMKFVCNVCNQGLPTRMQLEMHMDSTHGKKTNAKLLQCTYCSCYLKHEKALKKHVLLNHKTSHCVIKLVKFSGKCAICSQAVLCNTRYNNHVSKVHWKIYYKSHKASKHPVIAQKNALVPAKKKPDTKMSSQKVKIKAPVSKASCNLTVGGAPVPKQTLFKCNKCQIHFVTCRSAFDHSKRCVLAKGDWKCSKCRRTFTHLEEPIHTLQHEFSDKFKVHTVNDTILSRVLCCCPKCKLHFEERSFWRHFSSGCVSESGIDCTVCDIKIHAYSYPEHKKSHAKYKYTRADYILIEFEDVCFQDDGSSKDVSATQDQVKETQKEKHVFFFCVNCKTHMTKIRENALHRTGECQRFIKKYCHICGLLFHYKNIKRHIIFNHNLLNLKLADFTFIRMQDKKVMNPMIPDFLKCEKCKIRFVNRLHIKEHKCATQAFTKCSMCSRKYDSESYSLHLPFHDYGRSSPGERRSSAKAKPQIFFSCASCNYGFNTYDSLVDHCQKHYTNSETLATSECKICNLNYTYGHKSKHFAGMVFKILKFKYESLLSDDWLKGFQSVSKGEIEKILSKSLYGAIRNVRLMLTVDGPSERSLYKCAKCELCFEPDNIIVHVSESCKKAARYTCTSCTASFPTLASKEKHIEVHVVYGDDIAFREIVFNDFSDRQLNDALRASVKEPLKFKQCQQCRLLIKKSEYQCHLDTHKIPSTGNISAKGGYKTEYTLLNPKDKTRKTYIVYQCKRCKACIMNKSNIRRHGCQSDVTEQCTKCSLRYRSCFIKRHNYLHATIPKFLKSNITVIEFEMNNTVRTKRRRYSSDDDPSTGSVTLRNTIRKTYATRRSHSEKIYSNLTESENSQDASPYKKECDIKVEPKIEPASQSLSDRTKGKLKNKFFQCETCYLIFLQMEHLLGHVLSKCVPDDSTEIPFTCDLCNINYHPTLTDLHNELHETFRENQAENYIYLVNISLKGKDPWQEENWLFRCKQCDVHYMSLRALELHNEKNHKNVLDFVNCEFCELRFTVFSRGTHLTFHHRIKERSESCINVATAEKKTINTNKLLLPALSTEHCNDVEKDMNVDKIADESAKDAEEVIDVRTSNSADINNIDNETLDSATSNTLVKLEGNYVEVAQVKSASKRGPRAIDETLYKCVVCGIHFINKDSLNAHVKLQQHFVENSQCDVCGLAFTARTMKKHKFIQHKLMNFSRNDFVITTLTGEQVEDLDKGIDISNTSVDDTDEDCIEKGTFSNVNQSAEENQVNHDVLENTHADSEENCNLYKCVECSTNYIDKKSLLDHMDINKHDSSDALDCDLCGLRFDSGSLINHKRLQHERLKLSKVDFITTVISASELYTNNGKDIFQSSVNTDLPVIKLENKEVPSEKGNKLLKLYQCKDCSVCVLSSQRKLHVCCSDIQKKHCIKCSLSFRRTDFRQHRSLHKKYHGLSRKNFSLTKFGHRRPRRNCIYKCTICSTHFVSLNALEWHMDTWNHQTKRVECERCGLYFGKFSLSRHMYIHHTKFNLTTDQFNIVCVSTSDNSLSSDKVASKDLNNILDTTVPDTIAPNSNITRKLYRCFECEVYFLTQSSYYKHVYKHVSLDPTEFIACKICDLQFLTEDLVEHMRSHRDKSFSLDKLLIQEYKPKTNELIEKLFAADSLNSKLVSTTTPFDNEDETVSGSVGEQLSTVDSTSDEITKMYVK